jgi:haloalkane dehalogenase
MAENSAFASVEERNLAVLGSRMAYVEAGKGVPVLFLHGNPTSSFIWRNVIPEVAPVARCIAPDLIGFGRSDKPDLEYGFADHVRYLDAFIDALGLERFVLVAQDWGTALAFHFAARRPAAVLGLAFMEFIRPFASWDEFHQRDAARALFKALRMPGEGESLVFEEEMQAYRSPFLDPASRRPVLRFPRELPIEGEPKEVHELLEAAHAALRASSCPKLLFAAEPGALVSPAFAEEFVAGLENCRLVKLGAGAHYLQEDHAQVIGLAVAHWMAETGLSTEAGLLARAG